MLFKYFSLRQTKKAKIFRRKRDNNHQILPKNKKVVKNYGNSHISVL